MIIAIGSLIVMVVLLVAYVWWVDRPEAWNHGQTIPMGFAFVPATVGLIGIGVLWTAYVYEWSTAVSFGWSIACTAILAFFTLFVGWGSFVAYSEDD